MLGREMSAIFYTMGIISRPPPQLTRLISKHKRKPKVRLSHHTIHALRIVTQQMGKGKTNVQHLGCHCHL